MILEHVLNKARLSDGLRVTVLRALTVNGPKDMLFPKAYTRKVRKKDYWRTSTVWLPPAGS